MSPSLRHTTPARELATQESRFCRDGQNDGGPAHICWSSVRAPSLRKRARALEWCMRRDFVGHLLETRPTVDALIGLNIVSFLGSKVGVTRTVGVARVAPASEALLHALHMQSIGNTIAHLRETKTLLKDQLYWPYPLRSDAPSIIAPALHIALRKLQFQLDIDKFHKIFRDSRRYQSLLGASVKGRGSMEECQSKKEKRRGRANEATDNCSQQPMRPKTPHRSSILASSRTSSLSSSRRKSKQMHATLKMNGYSDCGLPHQDLVKPSSRNKQAGFVSRAPRFLCTTASGALVLEGKRANPITRPAKRVAKGESLVHKTVTCSTFSGRTSFNYAKDVGMGGRSSRFGTRGTPGLKPMLVSRRPSVLVNARQP